MVEAAVEDHLEMLGEVVTVALVPLNTADALVVNVDVIVGEGWVAADVVAEAGMFGTKAAERVEVVQLAPREGCIWEDSARKQIRSAVVEV